MDKEHKDLNNQQIINYIISGISNGAFEPGGRLPSQRDIARLFDVDRSIVRDAMKILEDRQYITIKRGSGAYVSPLCLNKLAEDNNKKDLLIKEPVTWEHIRRCMSLIWLESARHTAKQGSQKEIDRLSDKVNRHYQVLNDKTPIKERFLYYFSFSTAIVNCTHNPLFIKIYTELIDTLGEILMLFCTDFKIHKHFVQTDREIVDAIQNRDIDRVTWLASKREYQVFKYLAEVQQGTEKTFYLTRHYLLVNYIS